MAEESAGGLAVALSVRASEVPVVRRLALTAGLLGFALVLLFAASNALFLTAFAADDLPWVYIANGPLVIVAGLAYAAWSRRSRVPSVLKASAIMTAVAVLGLWAWSQASSSSAPVFALATAYRFVFVFSILGLWEVVSAQFDVRQGKRLFPVVAAGTMAAFMIGGVLVSPLTSLLGTRHLVAVSAVFLGLYAVAFGRVVDECDFSASDAAVPATPREILADPFSRNLASLKTITMFLIFITEFIFYEQVAATFTSDTAIARFLGVFMAVGTLAMVLMTALVAGRYIARYGVKIGLITMPAGLMVCALAIGAYGIVRGVDLVFFWLVVLTNFASLVLANAIETPVGAVLFQPMPVERRMPVRVAVDGWLGSAALLATGVLLLVFDVLSFTTVVPFAWLLAAIGAAGVWVAARLYQDYRRILGEATAVAFSGQGEAAGLDPGEATREVLRAELAGEDPRAVMAVASLLNELEDNPLAVILPELVDSDDADVAELAIAAMAESPGPGSAATLIGVANDTNRAVDTRAAALTAVASIAPDAGAETAHRFADRSQLDALTRSALAVAASALPPSGLDRLRALLGSESAEQRRFAAATIAASDVTLDEDASRRVGNLLNDADPAVVLAGLRALAGRLAPELVPQVVATGRQPEYRQTAVQTLASDSQLDVPVLLDPLMDELPDPYRVDLIDEVFARRTRSPRHLHRYISPDAPSATRRAGFDALRRAEVNPPATLLRMLRDDVEFLHLVVAAHRDLVDDRSPLITDALHDEFVDAQSAIFAGLRLSGNSTRIGEVEMLLRDGEVERRANGVEVLDTLLPTDLRLLTVPALEAANPAEATETFTSLPDVAPSSAWLSTIADGSRFAETTRALARHSLLTERAAADDHDNTNGAGTHLTQPRNQENDMSSTIERVIALKRIDIFASLPVELLTELASVVRVIDVAPADEIITAGDFGDELFALVDGEVTVEDGTATAAVLSTGEVFGELAVLAPAPRSATVTAKTECALLVLSREMLLALTARRPEVMAEIARVLAQRLRATNATPVDA